MGPKQNWTAEADAALEKAIQESPILRHMRTITKKWYEDFQKTYPVFQPFSLQVFKKYFHLKKEANTATTPAPTPQKQVLPVASEPSPSRPTKKARLEDAFHSNEDVLVDVEDYPILATEYDTNLNRMGFVAILEPLKNSTTYSATLTDNCIIVTRAWPDMMPTAITQLPTSLPESFRGLMAVASSSSESKSGATGASSSDSQSAPGTNLLSLAKSTRNSSLLQAFQKQQREFGALKTQFTFTLPWPVLAGSLTLQPETLVGGTFVVLQCLSAEPIMDEEKPQTVTL